MKIYYGILNNLIDVTNICFDKLKNNNVITIPNNDIKRSKYFTDPIRGILKQVFIEDNGVITEYNDLTQIKINILDNSIQVTNDGQINTQINNLHSKLFLNYGSFKDELPEQKMVVRYLKGNEKVLEIGGNIGRNSLIIASILNNNKNLIVLESNLNIAKQLTENRDINNFDFNIECSALSNRKLIQSGWVTIPSDVLQEGYNWVDTITLVNLKSKYNFEFDTLVLDCEGAFYFILMDMPEILNNVNLIIMENDYLDISHKNYIDNILTKNNFYLEYFESGGWAPCYDNFFEVWKKNN